MLNRPVSETSGSLRPTAIARTSLAVATIIVSGAALSGVISSQLFPGGSIMVPATWTAANIGFKVCDTQAGTFVPLRDQYGGLVQITGVIANAAGSYSLPDALFGSLFIELWSCDAAGNDVNQGADRIITVVLKG